MRTLVALCVLAAPLVATQTISVQVDASQKGAPFRPVWNFFGYDEPNYTYAKNGQKLIRELSQLDSTPTHIRTHFLLTTGDGAAQFKFGSTNAYTEDAKGKPVYDWTTVDRIIDTFINAGVIPLVEIGFMPEALSSHPEPYQQPWKPGDSFDHYYLGWTYPPRDYDKWRELVYRWVRHSVERYGVARVASWEWEVWNEPNIGYWHGSPEEYDKLYDYTADAVKRTLPLAKVGGPASTGPANPKAAHFLSQFLEHCANGRNFATGKTGAPLDFITFHAKGHPEVVDGHVEMGLKQELNDVASGFAIVHAAAKFHRLPIVITEADPEGCAACSAAVYPPNAYRNGTLYPAYTAAALKSILELARLQQVNFEGMLTWAFEFEDQPYFAGFRTLATNGIDKPVLNLFRMAGLMHGELVPVRSSAAVDAETIRGHGVTERAAVDALATASDHSVSILLWHYQDKNVPRDAAPVDLQVNGLPRRVLLSQYRIDEDHSNAYTAWQSLGSPQKPDARQYTQLERAGGLQLFDSPRWIDAQDKLELELPLQSISLIVLTW